MENISCPDSKTAWCQEVLDRLSKQQNTEISVYDDGEYLGRLVNLNHSAFIPVVHGNGFNIDITQMEKFDIDTWDDTKLLIYRGKGTITTHRGDLKKLITRKKRYALFIPCVIGHIDLQMWLHD